MRCEVSCLLFLSNEIWKQIIDYIPIKTLSELRFISKRFRTITTLSKRLEYYRQLSHRICEVNRLHNDFAETYDELHGRFCYYFNSRTRLYLKYRMQFIKNVFAPSNIHSHMFECPRSEYAINKCSSCPMLHSASHRSFFITLRMVIGMATTDGFSEDVETFVR